MRPTVHFTPGTFHNYPLTLMNNLLDWLSQLPVSLICTAGPDADLDLFAAITERDNVYLSKYIPHELILPHCDMVVTAGGFSTVMGALQHSLPLLVIPLGSEDKPGNAKRKAYLLGVGASIAPADADQDNITRMVMELLTVPSYRVAASRVGDCIERMPGPDSAAAGAGKYLRTQTWQSGKDMKRTRIIVVACAVVAGVLVVTLFFTLRSSHKEISGVIAPLICVHHIPSRHEGVVMGPYWVYDDSWATRTCIRPEGVGFKVETNARPDDDEVVAYPDIRYGSAYGFTTPGSDLPVPISRIGSPLLTATADGNAGGIWIADFDAWFFPTSDVAHHGTAEMVIILRYPAHSMTGGPEVTVDGRKWWLEEWTTCERDPGGSVPCRGR